MSEFQEAPVLMSDEHIFSHNAVNIKTHLFILICKIDDLGQYSLTEHFPKLNLNCNYYLDTSSLFELCFLRKQL